MRRRGRPRSLDRETALGIAAQLFCKRGYEGTSIADLTQALGVTPPSIYAAFGSKEELFGQAVDFQIALEGKLRTEALLAKMPVFEALQFYLRDIATSITNPSKPRGCMVSNAALQHSEASEGVARALRIRREEAIQMLKNRFDRAVMEGELSADVDTRMLARFYGGTLVQGLSAQAFDSASTETLLAMIDLALSAWPGKSAGKEPA